MSSTPLDAALPFQVLQYLPTYRVLICLRCRYAIQPGAVGRHLKEIHDVRGLSLQAFVKYASEFELAQPNDVVLPDKDQFPVPLLPIQEGVACCFDRCSHLCATTKRMKQHWRLVHHTPATVGNNLWKAVPLQTFFRGNALRYFTNPAFLGSLPSSVSDSSDALMSESVSPDMVSDRAVWLYCIKIWH